KHMGNRSIYPALSKLEAEFPTTVPIRTASGAAVESSANPSPRGLAKLKVHYAPLVAGARQRAARREAPRPGGSIPKGHASADGAARVPPRLRHSLDGHLAHVETRSPAAASLPSAQ